MKKKFHFPGTETYGLTNVKGHTAVFSLCGSINSDSFLFLVIHFLDTCWKSIPFSLSPFCKIQLKLIHMFNNQ